MNFSELKDKTAKELQDKLPLLAQESMNLRFRKQLMELTDTSQLKKVRKQVARIKTLLHQKELGGK